MIDWDAVLYALGIPAAVATIIGGVVGLIDYFARRRLALASEKPSHTFQEKDFDWLFERKLSYVDLLKRLIAIDVASIEHLDFDDPAEGTAAQWAPVFEYSPETWRLIVYNQMSIAAYWQAVSLKPSAVRRLKCGTLKDSRIFERDVRRIDEPEAHCIYFIYIGRHPDFERDFGPVLFQKLMASIANFCDKMDEDGVVVSEVFANGQTDEGIKLCRRMGMKEVGEISQGGPLFHSAYKDLNWPYLRKFRKNS